MKAITTLIAIALLLGGCATAPDPVFPESAYGPPPANWRSVTLSYIKSQLKDPYSAKIRLADQPPQKTAVPIVMGYGKREAGYQVLAYVNAKNSYGGYTGESLVTVYFLYGRPYLAFGL